MLFDRQLEQDSKVHPLAPAFYAQDGLHSNGLAAIQYLCQ